MNRTMIYAEGFPPCGVPRDVRYEIKIFDKIWSNSRVGADVIREKAILLFWVIIYRAVLWTLILPNGRKAGAFKSTVMSGQPRVAKVLVALLVSMTTGAIVLMALGNNPPSEGPFCLSSYYHLDPVEKVILSRACQSPNRWSYVEIYYSGTKAGNIEQLASLNGLASAEDLNCHFVVCNGLGGSDGQIQSTEKWQRQWSIAPGRTWYGSGQTIRICAIADPLRRAGLTDCQIKRIETLVEGLCRKFNIQREFIYYPGEWQ